MSQDPSTTSRGERTAQDQPEGSPGDSTGDGLQTLSSRPLGRLVSSYGRAVLAAFGGLLVGLFVGYAAGDLPIAKQPDVPSMSQCVADTLNLVGQKNPPTSETLRDAREHCYSLIQAQGILSDFAIRKLNFFQQYRANGVLMSMVVAITVAGVLLAGFQLWASYQLAAARKTPLHLPDSKLTLKLDHLALTSSIPGLFILAISFCFFLVFVFYVYRLETPADQSKSVSPPVLTLPKGGLGPPPPEKGKP